jgi:hypothetical protein
MSIWRLLGGTFVALLLTTLPLAGQRVVRQKPVPAKPISFGNGVRARDRLSPTPQYAPLTPGLYARQIVQADSAHDDYKVQVWSLLVSPHANTAEVKLPGAAVVTLYAGRVEVIAGDRKTSLDPSSTTTLAEGSGVRFVNADDKRPAVLRAVVLVGNQ